jgi:hypothetical protein
MVNYTRTEGTPHVNLHTEVTIGYTVAVAAGTARLLTHAVPERTALVLSATPPPLEVLQGARLEDFYDPLSS